MIPVTTWQAVVAAEFSIPDWPEIADMLDAELLAPDIDRDAA